MTEQDNNKCSDCTKDFCECVKAAFKAHRKTSKKRNVNSTLSFLNNNSINYVESNISNVVIINPGSDNVSLSLKRENGLLKVRFSGNGNWYTYSSSKFLEKFKPTNKAV